MVRTLALALAATLSLTTLSACSSGVTTTTASADALDPNLANPAVGDLWAAQLSHFSSASFSQPGGEAQSQSWGLLKVVAVDPTNITVITEQGAWPQKEGAIRDLGGTLADISWDESERITVVRAQLPQLVADEKILQTRRMNAQ